jgi:predicted DNA-binding protein
MSIQQIANSNTKEETKQVNFRLPKDLINDLKQVASDAEISQAVIVREAVREKINEFKQTNKLVLSLAK